MINLIWKIVCVTKIGKYLPTYIEPGKQRKKMMLVYWCQKCLLGTERAEPEFMDFIWNFDLLKDCINIFTIGRLHTK